MVTLGEVAELLGGVERAYRAGGVAELREAGEALPVALCPPLRAACVVGERQTVRSILRELAAGERDADPGP